MDLLIFALGFIFGSLPDRMHCMAIVPMTPLTRAGKDIKEQKEADQNCTAPPKKHYGYPGSGHFVI